MASQRACGNYYKINYKVFSNEFSIRSSGLNDQQGFMDASAVLMFAEKLRFKPVELKVIPYDGWRVTTGLDNVSGIANSYYSRDYGYLADCPILVGNQKNFEFFINDKKFTVSFPADVKYNSDTVVNDIKKITETVCDFWGDVPFEHYTYILVLSQFDYGATEHLNSAVFSVSPVTFSNKDTYNAFLANICSRIFSHMECKTAKTKRT